MPQQLRVMLDTNIYEFLYLRYLDSVKKLINEQKIVVYGCKVVRKELRAIPPTLKLENKNLRNLLLRIYDELTEDHDYQLEDVVENLAEQYWEEYQGGISKRKLMNDFLIVAISSVHNLDVVLSQDNNSMKSGHAIRAYLKVNNENGFRTPSFYSLKEFMP